MQIMETVMKHSFNRNKSAVLTNRKSQVVYHVNHSVQILLVDFFVFKAICSDVILVILCSEY